jgi:tRNA nucleotidyltransferase/poly(A) polymerase
MTDFSDLPNPQRRALDLVREVAAEKECRPYLVGGPVRDLLLGRHSIDVDVTLEDGSSTLARALAKRLNGRVRSFPQFLTYKVSAEGLPEIDIATARKERYRKPGALPTVTAGRLKDDLLRRDFSMNALAMDLVTGSMHDPAQGEQDIRTGVIRVLHDQSFLDDPTRIFRAIRFAGRLGFTLDPHTDALLRVAIAGGALGFISRERVWRELFLAMEEEGAPNVLTMLRGSGALDVLFGESGGQAPSPTLLEQVREQVAANGELDREVLYTAALLHGTEPTVAQLEGSGFSQKRARNVLQIARELPRYERAVAELVSDRQRFRLYKSVSRELLSILSVRRPEEQEHVARYHDYVKFKLPLRGNDLEVPLGPHVAKALERTREAVFSGEIDAGEARSFAREMAIKYLSHEQPADSK